MSQQQLIRAAESYIQAMRTGEGSAVRQAGAFLADHVVLITHGERLDGRVQVQERITGQWPMTPVYYRATWSDPVVEDHTIASRSFTGECSAGAIWY